MGVSDLPVGVKLAGFVSLMGVAFAAAAGVGAAAGPVAADVDQASHGRHDATGGSNHSVHSGSAANGSESGVPSGLQVTQDGYTFALGSSVHPAGDDVPISFTILGPDGAPVTQYDDMHSMRLHLIAVRGDYAGYQHVHPTLVRRGPDAGRWETDLDLTAGQWRLFADFTPTAASQMTLGASMSVPGRLDPVAVSGEVRAAEVGAYTVSLAGRLRAGEHSTLVVRVERNGQPVTDLDPYLEAYGHLVALREGDMAYLHVHPEGAPGDGNTEAGPTVGFATSVPSAGAYRFYLDFSHEGVVRTAEFRIRTEGSPALGGEGVGVSGDSGSKQDAHSEHDPH